MILNSIFSIETAIANQGGATFSSTKPMEADTISKNGRSSKSLMSRENMASESISITDMIHETCVYLGVVCKRARVRLKKP